MPDAGDEEVKGDAFVLVRECVIVGDCVEVTGPRKPATDSPIVTLFSFVRMPCPVDGEKGRRGKEGEGEGGRGREGRWGCGGGDLRIYVLFFFCISIKESDRCAFSYHLGTKNKTHRL